MEEPNEKYFRKLVGCEWEEREHESKLRQKPFCATPCVEQLVVVPGVGETAMAICVTGAFPQALTSCSHQSSPFPLKTLPGKY